MQEWSSFRALRISRGSRCDGGEEIPVGSAGVEQGSDPVVAEAGEPEGDALDHLDQVVGSFGGAVGEVGAVPRCDLVAPFGDRAAEPVFAAVGRIAVAGASGRRAGQLISAALGGYQILRSPGVGISQHALPSQRAL